MNFEQVPQSSQSSQNQLSPAGAWAMGALFVVSGIVPILLASGVWVPPQAGPDQAPPWVGVAAGLMFVMAGVAIILDYAIVGGVAPDGELPQDTPMAIQIGNLLLGGTIVGLMTSVFGWVAFGPGTRHFSSTIALPFLGVALSQRSSELPGRIAFGAATVLMAFMFVACTYVGIERLWRARRQ